MRAYSWSDRLIFECEDVSNSAKTAEPYDKNVKVN